MKTKRLKLQNWEDHFLRFLSNRSDEPLKWGQNDCVTFMADGIMVMTGEDMMLDYRGKYANKYAAAELCRQNSQTLLEIVSEIFQDYGMDLVSEPSFGDPVAVEIENADPVASNLFGGVTFGLYCGDGVVAVPGKHNLILAKTYRLVKAWKL